MRIDRYRGDGLPPSGDKAQSFPYLADDALTLAVNMAIVLRRALLLKGPPGCGKTRLADALAHELGLPIERWFVKSTTRAKDGLYTIDGLRRLQDGQLPPGLERTRAARLAPYITPGPLGKALTRATETVLLIDEIDKADPDFPNDLLRELDRYEFEIPELGDEEPTAEENVKGIYKYHQTPQEARPIIVVTSNDEKDLPDAFLRRCLVHHIAFPTGDRLTEIVQANLRDPAGPALKVKDKLVKFAVERFIALRDGSTSRYRKTPSTSELIDWVRVLHHWGINVSAVKKAADLPHWEMLFKYSADLDEARKTASGTTTS